MGRVAIAMVFVALSLFGCSERPGEPIYAAPQGDAQVRRGEIVFMRACEPCHPGGATGFGPAVVRSPHLPHFLMRFQIRNGFGEMPAFGKDQISDSDMDALMAYISALENTV